ncbi:GPALPP motifs-containing protein 1 isoform X2 [Rhinatrema bivittatum]|uniref:GPALPP motifs-containing protein 1 isoform X2 n=1 Tax=Rhinatrema bivittatum TaxID=194408 RepID=UPI00112E2A02|nr:GPALPP motifs-containing protein 1 isoform X2 [Rhinatrema bivittatum]
MSRDLMGPALPPGFKNASGEELLDGPALPPGYQYHVSSGTSEDSEEDEPSRAKREEHQNSGEENGSSPKRRKQKCAEKEPDDGFFGPALPPGFKRQADSPERPIIGPALPPGFQEADQAGEEEEEQPRPSVFSAFATKAVDSSEEEEEAEIGPAPAKGIVESFIARDFEARSQLMKKKLTSGKDEKDASKPLKREFWMTELPPELKGFGLGPRTFKKKTDEKSGDRSVWTDTPADKERKAKERQEAKTSTSKGEEESYLSERDKKMAEQVSSHNDSKRSESLLDLHQKKLKRKAEGEKSKPQERRPFDRDQDLHVNRFDEAQKKALLKKSRELNTKFSHGKGSMFL